MRYPPPYHEDYSLVPWTIAGLVFWLIIGNAVLSWFGLPHVAINWPSLPQIAWVQ